MYNDVFNAFEQYDAVWQILRNNDPVTNQVILCMMLDQIAGQVGRKGYELYSDLMPILMDVGEEMGVAIA